MGEASNIYSGKKIANKLLIFVLLVFGVSKNASSQSLTEILSGDANEGTAEENTQDPDIQDSRANLPSDTSPPQNTRAVYETHFAIGVMGGLNYNFLDNDCYNRSDNINVCFIGRADNERTRFDPSEQLNRNVSVLEARGLGYAGRAFLDWSINQTLGVRITAGYEHFFTQDTTKPHETVTSQDAVSFDCGAGPTSAIESVFGVGGTNRMACFASIDYLTIEGLVRYKMSSYSDLTPWLGVGVIGLLPIRWSNNILREPLPPRSGVKVAFGIDINLPDTFLFFPLAFDYTWLYRETNNEVRDQIFSLTAGVGLRF